MKLIFDEMTDEETYQNLKKLHKQYPEPFMNPKEWKRLRLIELRHEGRLWSR